MTTTDKSFQKTMKRQKQFCREIQTNSFLRKKIDIRKTTFFTPIERHKTHLGCTKVRFGKKSMKILYFRTKFAKKEHCARPKNAKIQQNVGVLLARVRQNLIRPEVLFLNLFSVKLQCVQAMHGALISQIQVKEPCLPATGLSNSSENHQVEVI